MPMKSFLEISFSLKEANPTIYITVGLSNRGKQGLKVLKFQNEVKQRWAIKIFTPTVLQHLLLKNEFLTPMISKILPMF